MEGAPLEVDAFGTMAVAGCIVSVVAVDALRLLKMKRRKQRVVEFLVLRMYRYFGILFSWEGAGEEFYHCKY